MSGLPREILKWMQSLDLSYSVKNVKRDFANGFLVAEILSRYHKGDSLLSLHSFDNGLGLVKRIQNWALLEKAFRKLGFPIERKTIDDVIHCKAGAAIPLMEQLYTLLTHKTITSAQRPQKDSEIIPPFARPTASQLIKERMFAGDLSQEEKIDATLAPAKAAAVLAAHMHTLKLERETDPARFQPKPVASPTAAKHAPRKSTGSSGAEGTFKEVRVRQVDDKGGVLQLRAAHVYGQQPSQQFGSQASAAAHPQAFAQPDPLSASASTSPLGAAPAAAVAAHPGVTSALQTLSGALIHILGVQSNEAQHLLSLAQPTADDSHPPPEPISSFVDSVVSSMPDAHAAFVISQLSAQLSGTLTELSLANPKEFWLISGVLFGLLERLAPESQSFGAAVAFVSSLGLRLVHRDARASTGLFHDFSLPKYIALLRNQPRKIFQAAKVSYAFVGDRAEEHGRIIRALHDGLIGQAGVSDSGRRVFFAVVAALAPFEGPLLVANNFALLNSYLKLVAEGSAPSGSARVRATALSILAPLVANPDFEERIMRILLDKVRAQLPPLAEQQASSEDPDAPAPAPRAVARGLAGEEWLLDAELLHVVSCALSQPWVLTQPALVSELHGWAEMLLGAEGAPFPTLRAGLAHLTHVLGSQPPLRRVWLHTLLEDDDLRARVLGTESGFEAAQRSSGDEPPPELAESFCPPLRSVWHPLTVAQSLGDQVRVDRLDNLALGHIEVLAAAVEDAFGSGAPGDDRATSGGRPAFPDAEASEWSALFLGLRDHLVVELCEPTLAEPVIGILRRFLLDPRTSVAAQTIFLPVEHAAGSGGDASGSSAAGSVAAPPLYCIMRFMFPSSSDSAQMSLAAFLTELATHPPLVGLVHRVLMVFADNEAEKFAQSPLTDLLAKLNQQAQQAGVHAH